MGAREKGVDVRNAYVLDLGKRIIMSACDDSCGEGYLSQTLGKFGLDYSQAC